MSFILEAAKWTSRSKSCKKLRSVKQIEKYFTTISPFNFTSIVKTIVTKLYINSFVIWSNKFYVNFRRVQNLQNKAIHLFDNYLENCIYTVSRSKWLRMLYIQEIIDYRATFFTYQCWDNVCPSIFCQFFRGNSNLQACETRNGNSLVNEYRNVTRAGFMILYLAPNMWNGLSTGIREFKNTSLFKKRLKKYFLKWGNIVYSFFVIEFVSRFFGRRSFN